MTIVDLCCTLVRAGIEAPEENLENAEVREKAALCLYKWELSLLFMAEATGMILFESPTLFNEVFSKIFLPEKFRNLDPSYVFWLADMIAFLFWDEEKFMVAGIPVIRRGAIAIDLKFYCLLTPVDGVNEGLKFVEQDKACIIILYF